MPLRTIGFALLILLAACVKTPVTADKGQESVEWAGHIFHEVRNLKELPAGVQSALGVGKSGLDGIADHGGKYNPTDVILSDLPMRRFLFAGVDGDATLVAVEHGGEGWRLDVILFDHADQKAAIDAVLGALSALFARSLVTPNAKLPGAP